MADSDTELTVEVSAPIPTEPPAEIPPTIVVEPAPVPEGDSVDAVQIGELLQSRERIAALEIELAELRNTVATAQATAEQTAEIVSMESEIAQEERQQVQEQVAELAEEMEPPDIAPNNSHPWFRPRDEWMRR